jgi:putative aminopeptidase FrvX
MVIIKNQPVKLDKQFLIAYVNGDSPCGMEAHLPHSATSNQERWAKQITPYVDKVGSDAYGNVWGIQNPNGEFRIVITAHADEIGWRIKYIDDNGYMTLERNGGSDNRVSPGTRGFIHGKEKIPVVFPFPAIHTEKHLDSPDQFSTKSELVYAYAGMNKEKLTAKGVKVGMIITHEGRFEETGDFYTGRAFDNRIGGVVIAEVAHLMKEIGVPEGVCIIYMNAVQEEVGLKGSEIFVRNVKDSLGYTPNAAICIDVCHGTDGYPMVVTKPIHGDVALGKGPVLTSAPAVHFKMLEIMEAAAEEHKIPIQRDARGRMTGTDTDSFWSAGIPVATMSIALTNMHTQVETIHPDDVDNSIALFVATLDAFSKPENRNLKPLNY